MSNAFNNFLSNKGSGPIMKDYRHASRLYVDDNYAYAPKVGFIYFVQLNINPDAIIDKTWFNSRFDVGLLVKRIDLPKFTVATETLNQYNRKTVVQTKLTYSPISLDLHDDNSDLTHNLWVNYFKHYYADSNYEGPNNTPAEYEDTKYGKDDITYGFYNNNMSRAFLDSIDIYVLHQGNFTKYTLINPIITEWQHDSVDQSEGSKILKNKLSVAYETVLYDRGRIVEGQNPPGWTALYYDKDPSPLLVAGNSENAPMYDRAPSAFDQPGANKVFGKPSLNKTTFDQRGLNRTYGYTGGSGGSFNQLMSIVGILAKNYVNQTGLTRQSATGYNIASGVLGAVSATAPGKYAEPPPSQNQPGIFTLPGGIGINIFKGFNTSVNGQLRVNPAALIFPPRG